MIVHDTVIVYVLVMVHRACDHCHCACLGCGPQWLWHTVIVYVWALVHRNCDTLSLCLSGPWSRETMTRCHCVCLGHGPQRLWHTVNVYVWDVVQRDYDTLSLCMSGLWSRETMTHCHCVCLGCSPQRLWHTVIVYVWAVVHRDYDTLSLCMSGLRSTETMTLSLCMSGLWSRETMTHCRCVCLAMVHKDCGICTVSHCKANTMRILRQHHRDHLSHNLSTRKLDACFCLFSGCETLFLFNHMFCCLRVSPFFPLSLPLFPFLSGVVIVSLFWCPWWVDWLQQVLMCEK